MIRRSRSSDRSWIARVSGEVYGHLGDYGEIIPSWLDHPGVITFVEQVASVPRGFILLGFHDPQQHDCDAIADLLAIAVDVSHQRRGVGRSLLAYAIDVARLAARARGISELRLTVAADNRVGRRMYRRSGFEVLDANHGRYDGGQRAIRMTRSMADVESVSPPGGP